MKNLFLGFSYQQTSKYQPKNTECYFSSSAVEIHATLFPSAW